MVYDEIAVRRVSLTEVHQADAEVPVHCLSQFLFVGRVITVFEQERFKPFLLLEGLVSSCLFLFDGRNLNFIAYVAGMFYLHGVPIFITLVALALQNSLELRYAFIVITECFRHGFRDMHILIHNPVHDFY